MSLSGLKLSDHWERMCSRMLEEDNHADSFARVISSYQQPHRHYHGIGHVGVVMEAAEMLCDELDIPEIVRSSIALAAFYHDVVYDPQSTENEIKSIEQMIGDFLPIDSEPVVGATLGILATLPGHEPTTTIGQVVSDADLIFLAGSWESYLQYVAGVKAEYLPYYTEDQWTFGRLSVLEDLLAADKLLYFAAGEEQIKKNLHKEFKLLEAGAL